MTASQLSAGQRMCFEVIEHHRKYGSLKAGDFNAREKDADTTIANLAAELARLRSDLEQAHSIHSHYRGTDIHIETNMTDAFANLTTDMMSDANFPRQSPSAGADEPSAPLAGQTAHVMNCVLTNTQLGERVMCIYPKNVACERIVIGARVPSRPVLSACPGLNLNSPALAPGP